MLLPPMHSLQNDLDSFILACYHGHRRLVRELITKYKMNQHVVNEVCVCMLASAPSPSPPPIYAHSYCLHAGVPVVGDIALKPSDVNYSLQSGWTGVLAAARYGHPDIVRDLVNDFGCNKDAIKQVC